VSRPVGRPQSRRLDALSTKHTWQPDGMLCTEMDISQGPTSRISKPLNTELDQIMTLQSDIFLRQPGFCDSRRSYWCIQIPPLSDDFLDSYCSCSTYFRAYQPPHHLRSNHVRRSRQVFDSCVLMIYYTLKERVPSQGDLKQRRTYLSAY